MERSLDYSPQSAAGALLPFCRRESNTMDGGEDTAMWRCSRKPEERRTLGKMEIAEQAHFLVSFLTLF